MIYDNFQLHKVNRMINANGKYFTFTRFKRNDFGELLEEKEHITIFGLYHEVTSYISRTAQDASVINRKSSPMILCTDCIDIRAGDKLEHNNKIYLVNEIKDLSESGIIFDISLEEVQK